MPGKVKVSLLPTLNIHAPHLRTCLLHVPACVHTYIPQILACLWSICSLSPLFLLGSSSSRRLASAKDWATNLLSVGGCGVYWLGPRPSTLLCTGEHSEARIVYNGYLAVQSCVSVQPEPLLSLRTLKLVSMCLIALFVGVHGISLCLQNYDSTESPLGVKGVWLFCFSSSFELGKFENTLAQLWQEKMQVCRHFLLKYLCCCVVDLLPTWYTVAFGGWIKLPCTQSTHPT